METTYLNELAGIAGYREQGGPKPKGKGLNVVTWAHKVAREAAQAIKWNDRWRPDELEAALRLPEKLKSLTPLAIARIAEARGYL